MGEKAGRTGIVFVRRWNWKKEDLGHFVNVVNRNGKVQFWDGQSGRVYDDAQDLWSNLTTREGQTVELELLITGGIR